MEPTNRAPSAARPWPALLTALLMLFSGTLGAAAGGAAVYLAVHDAAAAPAPGSTAGLAPIQAVYDIDTAVTDAVARVSPAVVTVINHLPPQRTFFGSLTARTASGSGVIVSAEGYVVTNNHVVDGAESLEVILADGTTLAATLVGTDAFADLAVVQVEGEMPAVAEWGNSDTLKPGETVIAIGSPLGDFKNTVTVGVVSATSRAIDTGSGYQLSDLIQTDAAINHGNSGGPLVNLAGQVIGINTLVVRGSGGGSDAAEGLGFAISSNTARAVTAQLVGRGYVARPYLGIRWQPFGPQEARANNLPVDYGVLLTEVVAGGPVDQAGIRAGDILTAVGDQAIDADHPFLNLVLEYQPGESVALGVLRGTERMTVEVILGERPRG